MLSLPLRFLAISVWISVGFVHVVCGLPSFLAVLVDQITLSVPLVFPPVSMPARRVFRKFLLRAVVHCTSSAACFRLSALV